MINKEQGKVMSKASSPEKPMMKAKQEEKDNLEMKLALRPSGPYLRLNKKLLQRQKETNLERRIKSPNPKLLDYLLEFRLFHFWI